VDALNSIKEGVLIYSAFQYTPEEYSNETWTDELVLYFDTKLLFSIYGFNGELFKNTILELMELIKAINEHSIKRQGNKIIKLMYFSEIKKEVDYYFKSAQDILERNIDPFVYKSAMISILNCCSNITDVIEKQSLFYSKLNFLGFECDDYDYFQEERNYKFNLLSDEMIKNFAKVYNHYNIQDIEENAKFLNKINILRRGKSNTIKTAKYFFLTATNLCLNLASSHLREMAVPLASTVGFFTEKMWIKTNRNFAQIGINNFNVVTKAQVIIKSMLNISIQSVFHETEKKYKMKEINIDQANSVLTELKRYRNTDSNEILNSIDEILLFSENSVEKYIDNFNYEKTRTDSVLEENAILKTQLSENKKRLDHFEESEAARKKNIEKIQFHLKTVIIFIFSLGFVFLAYFFAINRQNATIQIVLFILGMIGTLFSFLRFFGIDYKKIRSYFKN